jgi:predicted nucleic acid-binding protein
VRYLLDTCVISEASKKRPSAKVLTWLDTQEELTLFLSVITLGELQQGLSRRSLHWHEVIVTSRCCHGC